MKNDSTTNLSTFEARVEERRAGPCRLLVMPTPIEEVVSWHGSFRTEPDFAAGDALLQELTVALLDKGTRRRDRFALARVLEDRGAQLSLASDGLRIDVSGRVLTDDFAAVMEVLAEMLFEPLFDPGEFEKVRAQTAAALQRDMEDTGRQASGALARGLYPPSHPNHSPPPEALLARLQAVTLDEVAAYHAAHFGAREFLMAVVGDVRADAAAQVVEDCFGAWSDHGAPSRYAAEARPPAPERYALPMPDKMNVNVSMGHALGVRRQDEEYLPLYLGNYVLGGNFSARLMTRIRDEQGLTYGIRSSLSGISTEYDGHWGIGVTLSQDRLDEGVAATRAEVRRFVEAGITPEELRDKKTTITGSFKVGLATTGRLARTLLINAERGFDVGYLDRFPGEVEALTREAVNAAIRRHLHPERFCVALAGMLPEAASAP